MTRLLHTSIRLSVLLVCLSGGGTGATQEQNADGSEGDPTPTIPAPDGVTTPDAVTSGRFSEHLAPDALPRTDLKYTISARLIADDRRIEATERIEWRHPLAMPLTAVRLHLYLNAFSSEASTWLKESREASFGRMGINPLDNALLFDDPWGRIDVPLIEQQTADGARPCELRYIQPDDGNPQDRTLAEVVLPTAVPPGATLVLKLSFKARLPIPIARTGGMIDYFHAAQWFPKLGVYEPASKAHPNGHWAARQFHLYTEFYAQFADYDVTLELPAGYAVVATGEGQRLESPGPVVDAWRFVQRAVHDFAFVAGRGLHLETHSFQPKGSGPPVAITYVTAKSTEHQVPLMRAAAEKTFDELGQRVGPYPFTTMTVIQPPWKAIATSGMEYPTLVTGIPGDPMLDLEALKDSQLRVGVIIHEIIHNYFQGMVANDEQNHAFLDEGITSFWDGQIGDALNEEIGPATFLGYEIRSLEFSRLSLGNQFDEIDEAVIRTPASLFYTGTSGKQIYTRSDMILHTAQNRFGRAAIDRLFQTYFRRYRFLHPKADDFFATVRETCSPEMRDFLLEAFTAPRMPDYRVAHASSKQWRPPRGWISTPSGKRLITPEESDDFDPTAAVDELLPLGLDPAARESDGRVMMEIRDPGIISGDETRVGRVWQVQLRPSEQKNAEPSDEKTVYETLVRVRGPRWRHLPVDVAFEFSDGKVVTDRWDGHAAWRGYRFIRPARLRQVHIDPQDQLVIDPRPTNNGRILEPEAPFAARLAAWLTTAVQWLTIGGAWL